MLEWLSGFGFDAKGIIGSIVAALFGAFLKWLFDRREKAALRASLVAQEERVQRLDTTLNATHARLADQERQNGEKQAELERLSALLQGRGIDIKEREDRLTNLLKTLRDSEATLWAKFDPRKPFSDYDSRIGRKRPLILTLANLKGGVGKTTLTANLAGYFDRLGKRVLIIDLDYQGSLTTMLRSFGELKDQTCSVNQLFGPAASFGTLMSATRSLGPQLSRCRLAPAFYDFARFEDYLMVEWLLQQGADDMRYRLARLLLQDDVAKEFDVILIDVAPRMTTGTINALCASTHVLVPAIFNPLSAEPVQNFINMAKGVMDVLNPKLKFLGVVETMSPPANQGQNARAEGIRIIKEGLVALPEVTILKSKIPRQPAIADVGAQSLAVLTGNRATRNLFAELGREVHGRMLQ